MAKGKVRKPAEDNGGPLLLIIDSLGFCYIDRGGRLQDKYGLRNVMAYVSRLIDSGETVIIANRKERHKPYGGWRTLDGVGGMKIESGSRKGFEFHKASIREVSYGYPDIS